MALLAAQTRHGSTGMAAAVSGDPPSSAKQFADQIRPLLAKHCLECHGPDKSKGDLRLDQLPADFDNAASRERWQTVLKRITAGEMPPKPKERLHDKDARALTDWISGGMKAAAAKRAAEGRTVLRRLNRTEYENTIRDLLGIHLDLKDLLPEDASLHGFDNIGEALHTSSFLMERYLDATDKALNVAIANNPQPPLVKKRLDLKQERHVKVTTENVFRHLDDALVFFNSSAWQAVTCSQFYPPDRGTYRFRISAYAYQSGGKPVQFRVLAGPMLMATKSHLVSYFEAPPDKPAIFEFTVQQEARSTINILPYGLTSAQAVNKVGADKWEGPGLAVEWVEVEGPLHDVWPPESHRRIFGDLPQGPAPVFNNRSRVEVVSKDPAADAERILKSFARRAFRRDVSDQEIKPYVELVKARLGEKQSFEQAVRVGLKGILVSPEFLFLKERPHPTLSQKGKLWLDDFALASRLSYFLWCSMPDEELLTLASQKKLGQPEVLRQQVERMLKDAKAGRFIENFVGQWLGLRDIDFTEPSHILYPEFDHMLKVSMVREAELFFAEVLKDDLSLANFASSDFSMLNGRLARHYGVPLPPLPPVPVGERRRGEGGDFAFRKVKLPPESHRGGVMTMAAVLKVTANGTTTSPVMRGAWVLDRILGTPPPRPPADVPAVEPDIRGAVTIREQLAKHRQVASCATCHAKIDPAGFALESFDVIGGYREHYRTTGRGKPVFLDGRRMHYLQGSKVDPADELADGRKFQNIDEFKKLLLEDKDQLARALAEKLLTYATGRGMDEADKPEIDALVARIRDKNYGLRTLVHEIVRSETFRVK
jgi:mono/diheme cytochrome c family protein